MRSDLHDQLRPPNEVALTRLRFDQNGFFGRRRLCGCSARHGRQPARLVDYFGLSAETNPIPDYPHSRKLQSKASCECGPCRSILRRTLKSNVVEANDLSVPRRIGDHNPGVRLTRNGGQKFA